MPNTAFVVTFATPDNATDDDLYSYVVRALTAERGGMPPEDPMFAFDPETLDVRRVPLMELV